MGESKDIQDSVRESVDDHWEFLESFLESLVALGVIVVRDEKALDKIRFGFKLAGPHFFKHGRKDDIKPKTTTLGGLFD